MIHHGDCIEVMATLPEASVDAVITDPPYGLEFMGKAWDRLLRTTDRPGVDERFRGRRTVEEYRGGRAAQDWHQRWAAAAYRVAKPSAYLLAFGGTRTVHRMTCALEDAGWIIRDMLVWGYASGFPKSKASLKPAWEPIVMARKPGPLRMLAIDECRLPVIPNGPPLPTTSEDIALGRWPANLILSDPIFDGGIEGVVGGGAQDSPATYTRSTAVDNWGVAGVHLPGDAAGDLQPGYGDTGTYSRFFLVPKSSRSDREPIVREEAYLLHRARGDCDKLGAWDSEGQSRSEQTASTSPARAISEAIRPETPTDSSSDMSSHGSPSTDQSPMATKSTTSTATSRTTGSRTSSSSIPSPTSASILAANSETASGGSPAGSAANSSLWEPPTGISVVKGGRSTDDADRATSGSSSRRNVCGRCGKPLPRVSTHPTVKPVDLMRHLVRLVTPTGGVVLDPFLGSGTTALAAEMEGFEWIGIEREAEYVAIAEARLNGTQRGLGLEVG